MRVLVVSDSHSGMSFMLRCARVLRPDVIIHLGDYYDDGEVLRDENPQARVYLVAGNCDRYRAPIQAQELLIDTIGGVKCYMTHGHREQVKSTRLRLVEYARRESCQVALYGHTHQADCHQEPDGLWVMNPGSAGYYGGSVGLMELSGGRVERMRILREGELEEFA